MIAALVIKMPGVEQVVSRKTGRPDANSRRRRRRCIAKLARLLTNLFAITAFVSSTS